MPLKTLLVMVVLGQTWIKDYELLFPPFPGLGIRVDVYDVLNVDSVLVGDRGYDVTCFVHLQSLELDRITEKTIKGFGFEEGLYPF